MDYCRWITPPPETHDMAAGQYVNNNLRNAEVIEAMGMLLSLRSALLPQRQD